MTTRLERPLRREISIAREPWVITITPDALKLTRKGRRKGLELHWNELVNGDAALATALNASLLPRRKAVPERAPRPKGTLRAQRPQTRAAARPRGPAGPR